MCGVIIITAYDFLWNSGKSPNLYFCSILIVTDNRLPNITQVLHKSKKSLVNSPFKTSYPEHFQNLEPDEDSVTYFLIRLYSFCILFRKLKSY